MRFLDKLSWGFRNMAEGRGLEPPPGYSQESWEIVCKTTCSDELLIWVGEQLVGQDVAEVANFLSVSIGPPRQSSDQESWGIYYGMLNVWLKKYTEAYQTNTSLAKLIVALSTLEVPALQCNALTEKIKGLSSPGLKFKAASNDTGSPLRTFSSGSSAGSVCTFGELWQHPTDCTEDSAASPAPTQASYLDPWPQLVIGLNPLQVTEPEETSFDRHSQRLRNLRAEVHGLQREFAGLLRCVYNQFTQSEVKVDQLRLFLTQLCADHKGTIPFFSQLMLEVTQKATIEEIFLHLSRMGAWDFLSYLMLEDTLREFDVTSDVVHDRFTSYKEKIESFKKKTILMEFLSIWAGRCDDQVFPGHRAVIAKSIADPAAFTIADACDMASFISGEFSLKELSFCLANGRTGSTYVMWLVPAAVTKHMLDIMRSEDKPDLLQYGILKLAIEREVFTSRPCYESIHKLSVTRPRLFWGGVGAKELLWKGRSKQVFKFEKETGEFHWFQGAELNVSENCLDQHAKCYPQREAIIWERDDETTEKLTYQELLEQTCRVANVLKKRGIGKKDVVVIYMPTMPLAVASMLACARIGAVHCVVYSAFDEKVLKEKIIDVRAKAVITADATVVGGECKPLKEKVEAALKDDTSIQFVLVAKRTAQDIQLHDGDFYFSLEKEMGRVSSDCVPVPMDGEDVLFIAYTSGTEMGTSKAVYHSQFMFNPGPTDIIGCVSDLGWIAAHSYVVYGPLSNGNTTLLFESTATYPDPGRYWRMVDKLKLTHFYTVPSVLKELMRRGKQHFSEYKLDSLKVIASGGEPIPLDIQQWYYSNIGKNNCLFLDTWGQTEIGGTGIIRWKACESMERADFPSSESFPFFGVDPHFEPGELKDGPYTSELYLRIPLPGMGKSVLRNGVLKSYVQQHYHTAQEVYSTSDVVELNDKKQLARVTGRKDRALFIQGVWLAIPEIETVLRTSHAGTTIYDAVIVKCKDSEQKDEPGSVCAILQTSPSIDDSKKELAFFYTISTLASKFGEKILNRVKICFMPCSDACAQDLKKRTQTVSGKTSHWSFEKYLRDFFQCNDNLKTSGVAAPKWHDIDPVGFICRYS